MSLTFPVPSPTPSTPSAEEIGTLIGGNLRRLRVRNGLSLERLARASGVSRAMLSQIELGRSVPSITVLWKVASALGVSFAAFTSPGDQCGTITVLRAHRARLVTSRGGRFVARTLLPPVGPQRVTFHELRLAPHSVEEVEPHPLGTFGALVLSQGRLDLAVEDERVRLDPGDSVHFAADRPHVYHNVGAVESLAYLVVNFVEPLP